MKAGRATKGIGLLGLLGYLGSNTRNSTNSINSITLMFTTEAQRSRRRAGWFYPIEREPDWIKGASLQGRTEQKPKALDSPQRQRGHRGDIK